MSLALGRQKLGQKIPGSCGGDSSPHRSCDESHRFSYRFRKKYHRSYYYHSTIVEFIDSKEIPGTPNSRTPTPMVLPYHSYKNPLKYGNGLEACGILLCIESWIEHPRPKIIHAWSFVPWKLPGSFLLVLGIFTTFLRKSLRGWSSHFWSSLCDCIPYSCDQKLFRNPAYGEAPLGWSVGKTFQCIGCLDPLEKVQICASYQIANWTNWTKCWTNSTWQLSDNNPIMIAISWVTQMIASSTYSLLLELMIQAVHFSHGLHGWMSVQNLRWDDGMNNYHYILYIPYT